MYDFIIFASGSICLSGRWLSDLEVFYYAKFQPGDIAYDCEEATKNGKLIKVFIVDVSLIFSPRVGPSNPSKMYMDIYNGTWMERMLCTEQEAIDKAKSYWNKILIETTALNNMLNPSCRNS
jgi:hypothetical protein